MSQSNSLGWNRAQQDTASGTRDAWAAQHNTEGHDIATHHPRVPWGTVTYHVCSCGDSYLEQHE